MKLIRRRDYKTKKRIGFEGLYLEDGGFKENTPIDCSVDKSSGSIMIKVVSGSKKYSHKVTRNITRSGKTVPAICIKNKTIENFIESYEDLEIIIFKGIILLASKDKNRNIIISKALIAHNKSIRANIKTVVSSLISLGIITDIDMFKDLEECDFNNENILSDKIKRIPKKVLYKIKKSFRFNLVDKCKYLKNLTNISSNSFILSCIIDNSREYLDKDEDDEDDLLGLFVLDNYFKISKCFLTYESYLIEKEYLYKDCCTLKNNNTMSYKIIWRGYINIIDNSKYEEKILLRLSFYKRVEYFSVLIKVRIILLGHIFLKIRKLINTLSPPFTSKTCLKCLM